MAELVTTTTAKFEKGYLYFVKRDAKDNLCVYKAAMSHKGKKKVIK